MILTREQVNSVSDETIRNAENCLGCGKEKARGLVVCWVCFKYRKDIMPFKYFNGGLADWLNELQYSQETKI